MRVAWPFPGWEISQACISSLAKLEWEQLICSAMVQVCLNAGPYWSSRKHKSTGGARKLVEANSDLRGEQTRTESQCNAKPAVQKNVKERSLTIAYSFFFFFLTLF